MIRITIPRGKDFLRADGRPFRQVKFDANGEAVKEEDQTGVAPGQVKYKTDIATWEDMVKVFLNGVFDLTANLSKSDKEVKPLKHEDSSFATAVFMAMRNKDANLDTSSTEGVKSVIRLDKSTYDWFERILKTYGSYSEMFGVNGYVIYEPLDPMNIVDEDKETKKSANKG